MSFKVKKNASFEKLGFWFWLQEGTLFSAEIKEQKNLDLGEEKFNLIRKIPLIENQLNFKKEILLLGNQGEFKIYEEKYKNLKKKKNVYPGFNNKKLKRMSFLRFKSTNFEFLLKSEKNYLEFISLYKIFDENKYDFNLMFPSMPEFSGDCLSLPFVCLGSIEVKHRIEN
ncbi:hypothetical protein HK099_002739, partial [Clydaea vesicula]